MAPRLIDIVGHFGTAFSYATVASNVARTLEQMGLLGRVSNLDATWSDDFFDLQEAATRPQSTNVFVVTAPHVYMASYPVQYGRERSAIFMSPNTRTLSPEHARTCAKFSTAFCPSTFCAETVATALADMRGIATRAIPLSLGAEGPPSGRFTAIESKLTRKGRVRALHFSTDQWWPGRKGTEELLQAWSIARPDADLVLHIPPSLEVDARYLIRDLDLDGKVETEVAEAMGDSTALLGLIEAADMVIQPSRCEGFGIVLLTALVAGTPLICPYTTGQVDFLSEFDGWVPVPTFGDSELAGEEGLAPVIAIRPFANVLNVAVTREACNKMLVSARAESVTALGWTWSAVLDKWAEGLLSWLEESNE